MRALLAAVNEKSMKKDRYSDTLRPEYKLSDFKGKGVRGKYYKRTVQEGTNVVLDRDVAKAFPDSATVNEALRSLLKARRFRRLSSARNGRKRAAA